MWLILSLHISTRSKKAYGKDVKVTLKKVADTIAVYERTLVTPSRYDDFLNGKKTL